ncbi:hypothetical protein MSAN_01917400 [Mycena sanguinolenta]|uniref:Uncharacterized protein n=1 Tax=Mycena sanguinolenta TaxID=230812 RepID=A0A8H7CNK6_9AGAR|nr:hypothetical protein MSAN_01917400 [Mycena sanguinolenta]
MTTVPGSSVPTPPHRFSASAPGASSSGTGSANSSGLMLTFKFHQPAASYTLAGTDPVDRAQATP